MKFHRATAVGKNFGKEKRGRKQLHVIDCYVVVAITLWVRMCSCLTVDESGILYRSANIATFR